MEILYEDNHLLVVVKPVGMPVMEDISGTPDLLNTLKEYIRVKYQKPGEVYLGLVHRLDQPVGGVMVFARTSKAAGRLSEEIRANGMDKTYLCVAEGTPRAGRYRDFMVKDEATHSSRIVSRDTPGAKEALLNLEPVTTKNGHTLCRVSLITGRHHQIRVQLSGHGTPLWGDARYNPASRPGQDIALFCTELTLTHPTKKERMTFTSRPVGGIWDLFEQ